MARFSSGACLALSMILFAACVSTGESAAVCNCPSGFQAEGAEERSSQAETAEWCFQFCKCNNGCDCDYEQDGVEKENVAFVGIFSGFANSGTDAQIAYLEAKYGEMNDARATAKESVAEDLTNSNCNPSRRKKKKEELGQSRYNALRRYMSNHAVSNRAVSNLVTSTFLTSSFILGTTNCGFEIGNNWVKHESWHTDFEAKVRATYPAATFEYDESCDTSTHHAHVVSVQNGDDIFRYRVAIFTSDGTREKRVRKLSDRRLLGGSPAQEVEAIVSTDEPVVRGEVEVSALAKESNSEEGTTTRKTRKLLQTNQNLQVLTFNPTNFNWAFMLTFMTMDDVVRKALGEIRFELGRSILNQR